MLAIIPNGSTIDYMMDKFRIKEIESQTPEEIGAKLFDAHSKEGVTEAFKTAIIELSKPDLYYLEMDDNSTHVSVRKRADNTVVYYTDVPGEIETLKKIGTTK